MGNNFDFLFGVLLGSDAEEKDSGVKTRPFFLPGGPSSRRTPVSLGRLVSHFQAQQIILSFILNLYYMNGKEKRHQDEVIFCADWSMGKTT